MHYDLGFFDHQAGTVTSAENPFGAKVLPVSSAGINVTDVPGMDLYPLHVVGKER